MSVAVMPPFPFRSSPDLSPPRDPRCGAASKLIVAAWGAEGCAALINLTIATATGYGAFASLAAREGTVGASVIIDIVLGSAPFLLVAWVELMKIPIATAIWLCDGLRWRLVLTLGLAFLMAITFLGTNAGFERHLAARLESLESLRKQAAVLAEWIDQKQRETVTLAAAPSEAEHQAAFIKEAVDIQSAREREQTELRREADSTRDRILAAADEAGLRASIDQARTELGRLDQAIERAKYRKDRETLRQQRTQREAALDQLEDRLQQRLAARDQALAELEVRLTERYGEISRRYEAQLAQARERFDRQLAQSREREAMLAAARTDLAGFERQKIELDERLEQAAGEEQLTRAAALLFGRDSAQAVTKEELRVVAVAYYAFLAATVSFTGPVLAFAALNLRYPQGRAGGAATPGQKLVRALKLLAVALRRARTRMVVKVEVREVIKEDLVEKVVYRDVVKEVIRVVVKYIPVFISPTERNSLQGLFDRSRSDPPPG